MKIGDLATASSTAVETIRFYEREGLLPAPARTASNYRAYETTHLERLRFIRHCRGLDLSLDEVRVLLALRDAPGSAACSDVDATIDAHIEHVAHRIRELRDLQAQLRDLRRLCSGSRGDARCGILDGLARGTPLAAAGAATAHVGATHGRGVHGTRR